MKPASALTRASRLLSRPACPAGLRDRMVSPAIQCNRLTPENQAQYEPDSKRCHDCFGRIFTHVLLGIFLKGADTTSGVVPSVLSFVTCFIPGLLGFTTVFVRDGPGRRSQVFGGFARVGLAALQL